MNIFVLDRGPDAAAQMMCDKHVVKMIVESCQMLCWAHWMRPICDVDQLPERFYPLSWRSGDRSKRPTYANHPCTKWTLASDINYRWLAAHTHWLAVEYQYRYLRMHLCKSSGLVRWLIDQCPDLPRAGLTDFQQCVGDYKGQDPVEAYRRYYVNDKAGILRYTRRPAPGWLFDSKLADYRRVPN